MERGVCDQGLRWSTVELREARDARFRTRHSGGRFCFWSVRMSAKGRQRSLTHPASRRSRERLLTGSAPSAGVGQKETVACNAEITPKETFAQLSACCEPFDLRQGTSKHTSLIALARVIVHRARLTPIATAA